MLAPRHFRFCLLLLLLGLGVTGLRASTLEFVMRPVFAGEPVRLDSLRYATAAGETMSVTRWSVLLSGFALEDDAGKWTEFPAVYAWMDAAKQRFAVPIPEVPAAKFRAIRFNIGPDPKANSAAAQDFPADHPMNPQVNGLHWSWQGGYIFMALEGHFRAGTAELQGYAYHLARDANRTAITLSAELDLRHDASVTVDFDLAALLNAPRQISMARDGATTHARENDPLLPMLVANLRGAFQVRQIRSTLPAISQPTPVKPLYLPPNYTPYKFTMSASFPIPDLPRDNPLLNERVALGKRLFSDTALSRSDTISCASCHVAAAGFSDSRQFSLGVDGKSGKRHAMPLMNLAWKSSFFWDGRAPSLREQALQPIQDHLEMDSTLESAVKKLAPSYQADFNAAFGSPEVTAEKIGLALEQFLLTLTIFDSKFDQAMKGMAKLSPPEQRGFELFMTESDPRTQQRGADCFHCHGGALFSDHQFHNNGLKLSETELGRETVTKQLSDRGKFSTPSLRNISRTAPYMHDGRFSTLEEVVKHYSTGVVRSATLDPNLAKHPAGGLNLSAEDQAALVEFLKTLSAPE